MLAALSVLLLIGIGAVYYIWNKPMKKVEDEAGMVLSVDRLCNDFNTNEAAANKRYLNKAIEISGKVNEVADNLDGGTMIVFSASNGIDYVESTLREKITDLQPGTSIAVKGFCAGKTITGVSLTDCVLVR